ncbi:MAG: hypothetical protein AAGJ17_02945 [Pseudomonadota bacterium]
MKFKFLFFVLVFSFSTHGTVLFNMSIEELVEESSYVVSGVVESSDPIDVNGNIYTIVSIGNASFITELGQLAAKDSVKIKVIGGEIPIIEDGIEVGIDGQYVDGAPEFTVGEEVVVFINKDAGSLSSVTGLNQGLFRIDSNNQVLNHNYQNVLSLNSGIITSENSHQHDNISSESLNDNDVYIIASDGGDDLPSETLDQVPDPTLPPLLPIDRSVLVSSIVEIRTNLNLSHGSGSIQETDLYDVNKMTFIDSWKGYEPVILDEDITPIIIQGDENENF